MIARVTIAALIVCVLVQVDLRSQTFSPNTFNMGNATLGAPKYFDFVYKHDHPTSAKFASSICQGYAEMAMKWMRKSDSTDIENVLIPAGETVQGVLRLTPREVGPLTTSCGVVLMDSLDQGVGGSGFAISGFVTTTPDASASITRLEFGELEPATSSVKTIVLRNAGSGDAYMTMKRVPLITFHVDLDSVFTIKAKDSLTVQITFTPADSIGYQDTVIFGYAYHYTDRPIVVHLEGSGSSGGAELVAPVATVDINDVAAGSDAAFYVDFVAPKALVTIISAELRNGSGPFTLAPHEFPVMASPTDTFRVRAHFRPTASGVFYDTLVVTTAKNTVVEVALRGVAVTSGVTTEEEVRSVYPNPSQSTVHFCGLPLERWSVIDYLGVPLAMGVADEDGRSSFNADAPGCYLLISESTGKAVSFIVLR